MREFLERLITGIIFITVIIGCVIWNQETFGALFLVIVIGCVKEYHDVLDGKGIQKEEPNENQEKDQTTNREQIAGDAHTIKKKKKIVLLYGSNLSKNVWMIINMIYATLVFALFYFISLGKIPLIYLAAVSAFPLSWLIIQMHTCRKRRWLNAVLISMGLFYVALPLSTACFLVFRGEGYEFKYLLALLLFAWANDSFAYVFGNLFKNTKLSEYKLWKRLSPKKTWVGSIGGALGAVAFAFVVHHVFPMIGAKEVAVYHYMALAGIAAIMSTYGDLVESMLKRDLDIKDTGITLPGHGGFLDRFDGLLFAIPSAALYVVVTSI